MATFSSSRVAHLSARRAPVPLQLAMSALSSFSRASISSGKFTADLQWGRGTFFHFPSFLGVVLSPSRWRWAGLKTSPLCTLYSPFSAAVEFFLVRGYRCFEGGVFFLATKSFFLKSYPCVQRPCLSLFSRIEHFPKGTGSRQSRFLFFLPMCRLLFRASTTHPLFFFFFFFERHLLTLFPV